MKYLVLALAALSLCACDTKEVALSNGAKIKVPAALGCMTNDGRSEAYIMVALENLKDKFERYDRLDIKWQLKDVGTREFDQEQANIDATRVWVKANIQDVCLRRAYFYWLDNYQRDLNAARRELPKQKGYKPEHERLERDFPQPPAR